MHTPINTPDPPVALPRALVIPVSYETEPGLADGSKAIMEAARRIEAFDDELECEPFSVGVGAYYPLWDEPPFANTERAVGDALDRDQFPIVLGGEQAIALGAVRAAWKRSTDLTVVQITASAHRRLVAGNPYARGTFAARIQDYRLPLVQIGLRSLSRQEKEQLAGACVFWAKDYVSHRPSADRAWDIPEVIAALDPERPVYLSIDLGALDPAVFAASGTLEPGGLGWYPVLGLVRALFGRSRVVACDLCELVARGGSAPAEHLAARLLLKCIAYRFFGDKADTASP